MPMVKVLAIMSDGDGHCGRWRWGVLMKVKLALQIRIPIKRKVLS